MLSLIFPARCLGCHRLDTYLCPECLARLPPAEPPETADTLAVFSYQHPLAKRVIWKLKYDGLTALADTVAVLLADRLLEYLAERVALGRPGIRWLITAIPTSRRRGYNQAALVAQALARRLGDEFAYTELLTKTRVTPAQSSFKERAPRLTNLRRAFVASALAKGRSVIIIDDVITTGATLAEARRALAAAQARVVVASALAQD